MKAPTALTVAVIGAIAVAAAIPRAFANDPPKGAHDQHKARGDHMWQQLDSDKDGRISKAEADAGKRGRLAEHFGAIDANQDGFLTREEMQAKRGEMRSQMRDQMQRKWQEADANSDGQLSLDEAQAKMPRIATRFTELDADKNGYLSQDELRAAHHRGKHHGASDH